MNLILALLLATGDGGKLSLSPAPGAPLLVSVTLGTRSVPLNAAGEGEVLKTTPLSSPGLRFYRAIDPGSGRERAYYFPSSYTLVRVPLIRAQPTGGGAEVVIKELTRRSWKDAPSYKAFPEGYHGAQTLRFVLRPGLWDIALLVVDHAPEFNLSVKANAADLILKPLSLRRAAGVRAEILDGRSGRPPNRWSAFVAKLTADPQTEEARFFSDRPIASDKSLLDFRSLPIGGWELRVEAAGIGRRRALVSALAPGKSVDLGRFFISSVGAVRATLRFPSEIPPGEFAIRLSKDPSNPAEPTQAAAVATKTVTPTSDTVVTFADLEPGVWKVEAENTSGQIRREAQVAVEASQISETLLTFSPVMVVGTVRRGDELVEGATVRAAAGEVGLERNPAASSNSQGEYALKVWAPPGRIALMTFPPDEQVPFSEMLQVGAIERLEHDVLLPAGQVKGTVRDAETGRPLRGARVEYGSSIVKVELAENEFRFSLRKESDGEGRFRLGNLSDQPIDVRVSYEGYAPAVYTAVKPRPDGVDLDVRLTKGLTLRGIVVDETGRPIQGATVGLDTEAGGLQFDRTANTPASGQFEFRSLEAGAHLLFIWKCGSSMAVQPVFLDVESRSVQRVLLPPDTNPLIARFIDESGKPLPRVTARWVINGQSVPVEEWGRFVVGCGLSPFSDGDGNLALRGFPPGALVAFSIFEQRPLGSFQHDGTQHVWTIRVAQGTR